MKPGQEANTMSHDRYYYVKRGDKYLKIRSGDDAVVEVKDESDRLFETEYLSNEEDTDEHTQDSN